MEKEWKTWKRGEKHGRESEEYGKRGEKHGKIEIQSLLRRPKVKNKKIEWRKSKSKRSKVKKSYVKSKKSKVKRSKGQNFKFKSVSNWAKYGFKTIKIKRKIDCEKF